MFETLGQAEELLAMLVALAKEPDEINRIRQVEYDLKQGKLNALEAEGKLEWIDEDEWFALYHLERTVKLSAMVEINAVEVRRATLGDWKKLRRSTPEDQIVKLCRGVTDEGGKVPGDRFGDLIGVDDLDDLQEVILFPFVRRPGGARSFGPGSCESSPAPQ